MRKSYRFMILFAGAAAFTLTAAEQTPLELTQMLNASFIQIKHCICTDPVVSKNHALSPATLRMELQALYGQANNAAAKLNKIDSSKLSAFLAANEFWTFISGSEVITQCLRKWDKADHSTHFSSDFAAFISALKNKFFRMNFAS